MSRILVSGSRGFVAGKLIRKLEAAGYEVLAADKAEGIDLISGENVKTIPRADIIIHMAARSFVPDSFSNPYSFYYDNVIMTLNLLEKARNQKSKFLYFSSYLYGEPEYIPIDEMHPLKPHNPYANSKMICENLCAGYHRDFGVPVIIFRPFNIYGPGQNDQFLIPTIISQLRNGKIILKDPRPRRDFIYVDDVIGAVLRAIESEKWNLEIFNLGSGKSFSLKETIDIISTLAGASPHVEFTNEFRDNEIMDTVADISNIKNKLEWSPKYDMKAGISEMLLINKE